MAGNTLDPWAQQISDQIDRKRGCEHFLKTWQKKVNEEALSYEMASAENLRMGKLLAERETKYWSNETAATLTVNELNVRDHGGAMDEEANNVERAITCKPLRLIRSQQRSETLHMIRSEEES